MLGNAGQCLEILGGPGPRGHLERLGVRSGWNQKEPDCSRVNWTDWNPSVTRRWVKQPQAWNSMVTNRLQPDRLKSDVIIAAQVPD